MATLSVRDFGAACDRMTDDTAAIQAAIDAAATIPPGKYRTTKALRLKKDN